MRQSRSPAHDEYKKFPPYFGMYGNNDTPLTFHAHLLPFVHQTALYDNLVAGAVVPVYCSPMDQTQTADGAGAANFPVNLRLYPGVAGCPYAGSRG